MQDLYVQYGCGLSTRDGWLNYDASPTLRIQRLPFGKLIARHPVFPANALYGDIVKGLPVDKGTCAGIYCSHILEHLSREDCMTALRNTRVCLRPGHIFRFVLPDLSKLAKRYLETGDSDAFMREAHLGIEKRNRGAAGLLRSWLGNSHHLWMWDFKSMHAMLQLAGFKKIRPAEFGDSHDKRFNEVEEQSRWDNCLGFECVAE